MDTFEPNFRALIAQASDRNAFFTRDEAIQAWRTATTEDLAFWESCIPLDGLGREFLGTLNTLERTFCVRLALIVWSQTNYTIVLRKVQLEACLPLLYRKDSLFKSGTGSGKTVFMVCGALQHDPSKDTIIITISPLKRLQASQVEDFNSRYGIPTLAINEDTSRELDFFRENVYDTRTSKLGRIRHFIVTPEQLFTDPSTGHMPLFGQTLYKHTAFRSKISHIIVDECHTIHTAGMEHNGQPAFRPAWGRLEEVKARLPDSICWHGMTATLPPHMLETVSTKILKKGYMVTSSTSNRKNIIYATHPVVNSLEDMQNYRCFLREPYDLDKQPLVLLFFDHKSLAIKVANYLQSLLPCATREDREMYGDTVKLYYSDLSSTCLENVHKAFTPRGKCRILCATSGLSQGVDFPKVDIVCSVGVPPTVVEVIQRGGRAGRQTGHHSLFIVFYEPWVNEISLDEFTHGSLDDPDRTRGPVTSKSSKKDHVTYGAVALCQCRVCLRCFYAKQVGDQEIDALDFVTTHCCPFHPPSNGTSPFNLQSLLPGSLFTIQKFEESIAAKKEVEEITRARVRYRPVPEREALDELLIEWVEMTATSSELNHGFYNPDDILPFTTRQAIVTLFPASYQQCLKNKINKRLKDVICESKEWHCLWSERVLNILCKYDGVDVKQQATSTGNRAATKTTTTTGNKHEPSEPVGLWVARIAKRMRQWTYGGAEATVENLEYSEADAMFGSEGSEGESEGDLSMNEQSEDEESDWYLSSDDY